MPPGDHVFVVDWNSLKILEVSSGLLWNLLWVLKDEMCWLLSQLGFSGRDTLWAQSFILYLCSQSLNHCHYLQLYFVLGAFIISISRCYYVKMVNMVNSTLPKLNPNKLRRTCWYVDWGMPDNYRPNSLSWFETVLILFLFLLWLQ